MNRTPDNRGWLALSCTNDGTIVEILHDDPGIARGGLRLDEIVDSGSAQKAQNFIAALRQRDTLAGWQMNVPFADHVRTLTFAGSATEEALLIAAAPSTDSLLELSDEIGAPSSALRQLLGESRSSRDTHLYEELSRLNNELINRERELARKSAALERLSAEKSRVVAIAAHDLRNPLTIISSYADLLKIANAVEGEAVLYVDEISRSARFMMDLVEEMLDSSRLESGYIDVDLQDVDLVAAARHAATTNRIRAERKEITITFAPEADCAPIRADPVKLRQIINNLVVNAIKFSPSRTNVTLRVRCTDAHATIEVEDQGLGIPTHQLTAIFEPFKRLSATGTDGEKSTGLGLSIVKQLAELHHASVDVESEEGRGSRFRVNFPAMERRRPAG